MLIPERKDCETVLRALQRKRLNGWIDESDGEDFCVFYGKVKLKVIPESVKFILFCNQLSKQNWLSIALIAVFFQFPH